MTRLLVIDTETGGLDPEEVSLLSVGLVAWEDKEIKAEKEIFIEPGILKIQQGAFLVNKLNLEEHYAKSVPEPVAISQIIEFCAEHVLQTELPLTHNINPITIVGHNVQFDVSFLKHLFKKSPINYSQLFSHRMVDTSTILRYISIRDSEPDLKSGSLDNALRLFQIEISEGKRHTALGDAVATALLFSKLLEV